MSFLKGLGGALGTISPGLGMMTGKGLGGEIAGGGYNPLLGLLGSALFGGKKDGGESSSPVAAEPAQPAAPAPNAAASGLGKLIGVDGAKISSIADSVGKGMNMIAQGGGARGGYVAPQQSPLPQVNNYMQLMDPKVLQALVQYFGGGNRSGNVGAGRVL